MDGKIQINTANDVIIKHSIFRLLEFDARGNKQDSQSLLPNR